MLDQVGNPEDQFSNNKPHIRQVMIYKDHNESKDVVKSTNGSICKQGKKDEAYISE